MKFPHIFYKVCVLALLFAPLLSQASLVIRLFESKDEHVAFALSSNNDEPICAGKNGQVFNPAIGIRKISDASYLQKLNSEATDGEQYLKAARMGGGIYMYLPYFYPARECKDSIYEVVARHILWEGKWYSGVLKLNAQDTKGKAIFFTNELTPIVQGSSYFDAEIPKTTLTRLQSAFAKILSFYERGLNVKPQENIGVVAAVVRNHGGYSGYGGDAVNIIRMSFDNPSASQLSKLDEFMPSTFAHELAHKLQSDKLYKHLRARFIVEGQAEFLKVLVLFNSGVIDENAAKQLILKASGRCSKFSDARSMNERINQKSLDFREPYDCGMVYYFLAYYTSGLEISEFINLFKQAMLGEKLNHSLESKLCLLYESTCTNQSLIDVTAGREQVIKQIQWLESELEKQQLPVF